MADRTGIEWTERTWNPVTGCSEVSPGCAHCYARRQSERLRRMGSPKYARGFEVVQHESVLEHPLRWRKPSLAFVNSMSDLFHDQVSDEFIDQIFAVMSLAPQHVFQILTKRPKRMRGYLTNPGTIERLNEGGRPPGQIQLPLPNVWLGTSVEDQRTADERIPILLQTPAAVRWISAEPILGPIDLRRLGWRARDRGRALSWIDALEGEQYTQHEASAARPSPACEVSSVPWLDWVVCGGESGPGARPMDPAWARSLRDQCEAAGVSFFFKQWGGTNKKRAGRILDGRTWDGMPRVGRLAG